MRTYDINKFQNKPYIMSNMISEMADKIQTYTDTNMMVSPFANLDKLKNSDQRIHFGDENYHQPVDDKYYEEEHRLEDDVDDYRDKTNVFDKKNKNDNNHFTNDSDKKHSDERPKQHANYSDSAHDVKHKTDDDDDDDLLKKLAMLRKLGELSQAGVKLSQNYGVNSDYKTMKFEYELHNGIRSKQNAINWMGNMMIGIVKGIEMLNDNLNPFDIKFENTWSNKITSDITDYYDVLGEIFEKYTTPGKKMPPELKLFLMLTGSAISIQMHRGISNMLGNSFNTSSEIDKDANLIKELRQKTEKEDEDRKNKIIEKREIEHKMASEKVKDLQMMYSAKNEISKMQQQSQNLEKINRGLLMSESARSVQNIDNNSRGSSIGEANFLSGFHKQQQKRDVMIENQNLLKVNQMLNELNDKKPSDTKKSKNTDSETASTVSTVSELINPNIHNILGKKRVSTDTSSLSTSPSASSRLIKPIKVVSKTEIDNIKIDNIKFDNISFSKKSNNSDGTGKSKRGRPKKNVSIKFESSH